MFFRVLVVQFVDKRVKTHKAKTNTKSCKNELLNVSYMKHKPEQHKHNTKFHP